MSSSIEKFDMIMTSFLWFIGVHGVDSEYLQTAGYHNDSDKRHLIFQFLPGCLFLFSYNFKL